MSFSSFVTKLPVFLPAFFTNFALFKLAKKRKDGKFPCHHLVLLIHLYHLRNHLHHLQAPQKKKISQNVKRRRRRMPIRRKKKQKRRKRSKYSVSYLFITIRAWADIDHLVNRQKSWKSSVLQFSFITLPFCCTK